MSALALMGIASGLGALGRTAGDVISASSIYGKSDKDRLKELERLQQLSALGFKTPEMEMMQRQLLNPIQAEQSSRLEAQKQMLAAQNAGAGSAALLQASADQESNEARARASEFVMNQQLLEQQRQKEEIRSLNKLKQDERTAMLHALIGGGLETASEAIGTYGTAADQKSYQQAYTDLADELDLDKDKMLAVNDWKRSHYTGK